MPTPLRRAVTTPLLFLFILGDVLGAGVYALVGEVAAESGGALWLPLLIALGLAVLTAASYAELVTKYPRAGGASHYAGRAFGALAGFVVGLCMLTAGVVSVAGLARAFGGDYFATFLSAPTALVAGLFLVAVAALNLRGIKESLGANVVMTVVEVGGLLLVVVLGLVVLGRGDGDVSRLTEVGTPEQGAGAALLGAAVLAFYSFVGFETSVNVAEEVQDPRRSYPKALFGALAAAGLVYVLVGVAASVAVPTDVLSGSSGPLLEVVRAAGGVPADLFAAIALVAIANGALLTSIMSSRLAYGMARDGVLPSFLTRVLPGRRTPWVAILVTTGASLLLAVTGTLATLASTVVLLLLVVFVGANAAVLRLRRDRVEHDHFRTPTVLPVLGIASCVLLATQLEQEVWARGGAALAVGLLLGLPAVLNARRHGGWGGGETVPYPEDEAARPAVHRAP